MTMINGRGVVKQGEQGAALELEALEAELAGLPAAIAAAARTGDETKFAKLLIRERQVPLLITGLKSEAIHRRIAEAEAGHAAAVAAKAQANEDERKAQEAMKQAQAAERASVDGYGVAWRHQQATAMQVEAFAGQLASLRAELAALGA